MREIKFRAWDEGNKTLHKEVEFIRSGLEDNDWIIFKSDKQKLEDDVVLNNPYFQQQIKLMQYTGLKDKNNKEIYEGDLLKVELDWGYGLAKIIVEIYFKDGCFRAKALNSHEDTLLIELSYFDIIGNIYENSEMLEKGNGL